MHVPEPSVDETYEIMLGLRERYELHHGVRIADTALVAAAQLSDRYIADRFLPDKGASGSGSGVGVGACVAHCARAPE